MPVAGKEIEVNSEVEDNLELLAEDPYGEGWLINIQPFNMDDDLLKLFYEDNVEGWFTKDLAERG